METEQRNNGEEIHVGCAIFPGLLSLLVQSASTYGPIDGSRPGRRVPCSRGIMQDPTRYLVSEMDMSLAGSDTMWKPRND